MGTEQQEPKKDEGQEKPQPTEDSISQHLSEVDRTFDGKQVTEEEGAEEKDILVGHPAAETSQEEPESEGKQEPGAGEKKDEQHQEPFKPKYKSQEEAEAAVLEFQRQVTKMGMELQETKDLLLKSLARKEEEPPVKKEEPVKTAYVYAAERRKQVLKDIEALNPDDEDHLDKVAEIQAKADQDILDYHRATEQTKQQAEAKQQDDVQKSVNAAETAMKEAGLKTDPESEDFMLFWSMARIAPDEQEGLLLTLDQQIAWAINKVKAYKMEALEQHKTEEARKRAEKKQEEEDQPIGPGSIIPVTTKKQKPEAEKPASLRSVLNTVSEARVL